MSSTNKAVAGRRRTIIATRRMVIGGTDHALGVVEGMARSLIDSNKINCLSGTAMGKNQPPCSADH